MEGHCEWTSLRHALHIDGKLHNPEYDFESRKIKKNVPFNSRVRLVQKYVMLLQMSADT